MEMTRIYCGRRAVCCHSCMATQAHAPNGLSRLCLFRASVKVQLNKEITCHWSSQPCNWPDCDTRRRSNGTISPWQDNRRLTPRCQLILPGHLVLQHCLPHWGVNGKRRKEAYKSICMTMASEPHSREGPSAMKAQQISFSACHVIESRSFCC